VKTPDNKLLATAGYLTLGIAVFQAVISLVPEWSVFFGAPPEMAADRALLAVVGELCALFFALFGFYGLSGAGVVRRLPLLRAVLVFTGAVFVLRGLAVVLQILVNSGILKGPATPAHMVAASLLSLCIGVLYLSGTIRGWRNLAPEK
jgi:hypothetical protein